MSDQLALFTTNLLAKTHAKTTHKILHYNEREIITIIDDAHTNQHVPDVVPYTQRDVPIITTMAEATQLSTNVLIINVAPLNGALTPK